ncbi:hypothetical protein [Neobacillus soli]|uniref:hypothetical protein n=1 Tax=Neobacillus soli TaxID=220688 RepID=UPI0008247A03|nr:hypothetical protein [Neobacillus soli]
MKYVTIFLAISLLLCGCGKERIEKNSQKSINEKLTKEFKANVIKAEQLACEEINIQLPKAYCQTNVIMEDVATVEVFENEKIVKEVEVNLKTNKVTIKQTNDTSE